MVLKSRRVLLMRFLSLNSALVRKKSNLKCLWNSLKVLWASIQNNQDQFLSPFPCYGQELKFWCVETGSKSSIFNKLKILIVGIDKKKTQCKIVGRLICQQLPISKPKELRNIMVKFRVQSDEGEAKSHQNKHKGF